MSRLNASLQPKCTFSSAQFRSKEAKPQDSMINFIRALNSKRNTGGSKKNGYTQFVQEQQEIFNKALKQKPKVIAQVTRKNPQQVPQPVTATHTPSGVKRKTVKRPMLHASFHLDPREALDDVRSACMDDYLLGREIGKGSYAVVRHAIRTQDSVPVAVKTYEKLRLFDSHRKRGISREIQVLRSLDHPNIVRLYEKVEDAKEINLVMEYIEGCSLHYYLKKNRVLSESTARSIFRQVLSAVSYCHSQDITHRDIKLENILICSGRTAKLIDFGFATCFPHEKKVKMFCGTPSYMAPEIVLRQEYSGPPADVWALGVLLYVMLAGFFPFRGHNDKDLYNKISYGQVYCPESVPEPARFLIVEMLNVCPTARPTVARLLENQWFSEDVKSEYDDGCMTTCETQEQLD